MGTVVDISKLNSQEKLKLIDELWEDISNSSDFSVPDWHIEVVKEREQKYLSGEESLLEWNDVKKRLSKG